MSDISIEQRCQIYEFVMYTLIVGLLLVVGIIGNSLAFAVLWRGQFNKATSFFFMCLSLTDSAVLLTAFVCWTIAAFVNYTDHMQCFWDIHPYIVVYVHPLHLVTQTATTWVTVLITISRYINVCLPLSASQWYTASKVQIQLAIVLSLAVLYNIPTFMQFRIGHVSSNNDTTYTAHIVATPRSYDLHMNTIWYIGPYCVPCV